MRKRGLVIVAVVAALMCGVAAGCAGTSGGSAGGSANVAASGAAASDVSSSATLTSGASTTSNVNSLATVRKISWKGKELTVTVGTNKTTGCEWNVRFEDDEIVDYSTHRTFKLSDIAAANGVSAGTSEIGFKAKKAGKARIFLTTERDWEGNEPGYTFTVTVTVGKDGIISEAVGK